MKIYERQLMVLLQTTSETLKIGDRAGLFTFGAAVRQAIVNEVLNQQTSILTASDEPKLSATGVQE